MWYKIKDSLYSFLGISFAVLIVGSIMLLITVGAKLFEILNPILENIGFLTWIAITLLMLLSIVPRLRSFTGQWIIVGTYIIGTIIWFSSFYITYVLWGLLGIFIGVFFFGLGIFFTAILALIFDGQLTTSLILIISIAIVYLFRMFGYWIITKYRPDHQKSE